MAFLILFLFTSFIVSIVFLRVNNELWNKGKIPFYFRKTRENEFEVYVALAASIISSDLRDTREKTLYLKSYFHKNYSDLEDNFSFADSLIESYKMPTDIEEIGRWISKFARNKQERIHALQFAVSIAMMDGSLIQKEYEKIKLLNTSLGLSNQELDRIIRMYQRQQDNHENSRSSTKSNTSQKTTNLEILGLPPHASFTDVKKAYRKLAKLHHPDKFVNASLIQQKMAKERFVKIQEAYDFLERLMD